MSNRPRGARLSPKAVRKQTSHTITAYHEAGHAVAAIILGRPFKTVNIIGNEQWGGLIAYKAMPKKIRELDHSDARVIQIIERNIIVTFAGGIAQRRYAPDSPWRRDMGHRYVLTPALYYSDQVIGPKRISRPFADSDLAHIDDYLAYMGKHCGVARAYRASLRARTEELVEAHWPEIQRVARALLKQKTMGEGEVRRAMFASRPLREAARPQSKQREQAR
jgi:hypothetical protein